MNAVGRGLYVAVIVSLTACGCTLADCFGALTLNTRDVAEWAASETYVLRLCVAAACEERQVDSSADELAVFDFNGPDDLTQGQSIAVTLTVDSPAGTREASGEVTLEVMSPNGRACGPTCVSGHLTPVGQDLKAVQP
jgi:hypothetical protein